MDYTSDLESIEIYLQSIDANTLDTYNCLDDLTNEFIEHREQYSGDMYQIKNKMEKINTTTSVIAIVVVLMLLYNFIVRSFK